MPVTFDVKATLESVLFEAFSKFLYRIEKIESKKKKYIDQLKKEGERDTERYIFYCYVGQDLLKVIGARSVEQIFAGKRAITDDRFDSFCTKFQHIFNNLPPGDDIKYKSINVSFIQWRDEIVNKYNIKLSSYPITDTSTAVFESVAENVGNIGLSPLNLTVDEEQFNDAINKIERYYHGRHEEQFNEKHLFEVYKNIISQRINYEDFEIGVSDFDSLQLHLLHNFTRGSWEIYELDGDKINKSEISFGNDRHSNAILLKCGFECYGMKYLKEETTISYIATFDIIHRCISLTDITEKRRGILKYVTFSYEDRTWEPQICHGHHLVFDPVKMTIRMAPLLMVSNRSFNGQRDVTESVAYDIYDPKIPEHIRAYLLAPSKIETKPDRFLYKEITLGKI